jgi:hypothetical protein
MEIITRFCFDPLVAFITVLSQSLYLSGDDEKILRIGMRMKRNRDAWWERALETQKSLCVS